MKKRILALLLALTLALTILPQTAPLVWAADGGVCDTFAEDSTVRGEQSSGAAEPVSEREHPFKEREGDSADKKGFVDIPMEAFFAAPVAWAVESEITNGVDDTHFGPDAFCTRAQVVTFLWRAAGCPVPRSGVMPFADVKPDAFYEKAAAWAVENGITNGLSAAVFGPNATCTRGQVVTFLWRAAGALEPDERRPAFKDLKKGAFYEKAAAWAVDKGITKGMDPDSFAPEQTCTRSQIVTFLYRAKDIRIEPKTPSFSQHYSLYYGKTPLDSRLECDVNRPYVSLDLLCDRFDLDPANVTGRLAWPLRYGPDGAYIALADAAKLCRLGVEFRASDKSVHLYRLAEPDWAVTTAPEGAQKAYIRLEDIMADGGNNGRFTHENLNKLRLFGAYLRDHTDAFYIAWIPLYVNPEKKIRNDISRNESFYNADFVFTLDCLVADGGKIGLHGLTHQHADEISADGYEFGDDIFYTREEILNTFLRAEDICARMGYTYSFFEFPHYAASGMQKEMAEEHFGIIYQQYADDDTTGRITARTAGGHTCLWVPTPANCVRNHHDADGIADRLTRARDAGKEISLYFHPAMDEKSMKIRIRDNVMTFVYDEKNGILARIIRLTDSWGYRFSAIQ